MKTVGLPLLFCSVNAASLLGWRGPAPKGDQLRVDPPQSVQSWMEAAIVTSRAPLDCSEASLKTWTDRCQTLAESSNARTEMATALTVCEIAGVQSMSVPKECKDWSQGAAAVGGCVEAFSRSPQHWSSFTSFLRDVVQTCWALGSWHDSADLKHLYRNISLLQYDFVQRMMKHQEKRDKEAAMDEKRRSLWQNKAESAIVDMQKGTRAFHGILDSFRDQYNALNSLLAKRQQDVLAHQTSLAKVSESLQGMLNRLPSYLLDAFKDAHQQELEKHVSAFVTTLNDHLSQLETANEAGLHLTTSINSLRDVVESTEGLAVKQREMQLQALEMSASIANTTNEVENRMKSLQIGRFDIFSAAVSVFPFLAKIKSLRLATFTTGVLLILLSCPYTAIVPYFENIRTLPLQYLKHKPKQTDQTVVPWRTNEAKQFFSGV